VRFTPALADRKKHVYDEDIEALVDDNIATAHDRAKLISLSVIAGTRGPQRATMKIEIDGRVVTDDEVDVARHSFAIHADGALDPIDERAYAVGWCERVDAPGDGEQRRAL
jgi:hypothetical protein